MTKMFFFSAFAHFVSLDSCLETFFKEISACFLFFSGHFVITLYVSFFLVFMCYFSYFFFFLKFMSLPFDVLSQMMKNWFPFLLISFSALGDGIMATLAYGQVVQAFPKPEKDTRSSKNKKSPPVTLSAYAFLNSRLSQVKTLGIKILQVNCWRGLIVVNLFLVTFMKSLPCCESYWNNEL